MRKAINRKMEKVQLLLSDQSYNTKAYIYKDLYRAEFYKKMDESIDQIYNKIKSYNLEYRYKKNLNAHIKVMIVKISKRF